MTDKKLKTRHDRIIHNERVKLWSHTLAQVGVLGGVGGWAIAGIQWLAENEATEKQIWGALALGTMVLVVFASLGGYHLKKLVEIDPAPTEEDFRDEKIIAAASHGPGMTEKEAMARIRRIQRRMEAK